MNEQGLLFDPQHDPPPVEPQLARVEANIAADVIGFLRRLGAGNTFRMSALTAYVRERHPMIAPDSAGRILRMMRREGRCDYKVVSRAGSEYQILRIGDPK